MTPRNTSANADDRTAAALSDGRYLFCVVRPDETDPSADAALDVTGFDGESVSVVEADGVGAVVQPRTEPFDADDITSLERLLVRHQAVVDAAMEAFGTPLPVRFGTVLAGGDAGVREWLADECETLRDHLDELAGYREYRVSVTWDEAALADGALDDDEELRSLRERVDEATEGTAFMLEKQYQRRLDAALDERRRAAATDVTDRLTPLAREVRDIGRPTTSVAAAETDADLRLAVLASPEREDAIGDALDEIAALGADVRYTGPWAPYSFAPELGDSESVRGERAGGDDP